MNNAASILLLIFLAVTFMQSAYEKVFDWKNTVSWLQEHFSGTFMKNYIPLALSILLVLELLAGIFTTVGCVQILLNGNHFFGFYGAFLSCLCLIFMLFGQRLAKDYDGARTIAIYFIPAVLAVYWLG